MFLSLLGRFTRDGRNVSETKNAPNYAPSKFATEDEAKKHRLKKAEFEQAMRDLFKAEKIRMEAYGKSSLGRQRIALGR